MKMKTPVTLVLFILCLSTYSGSDKREGYTMKMKTLVMLVLCVLCLSSACGQKTYTSANENPVTPDASETEQQPETPEQTGIGKHHAEITMKDFGVIKVELDGDAAPITVQNFMDLTKNGFYDGLTIHRVQNGFMMQGGDPKGDGTGGSENTITGEFSANGIENKLSHTRGAISMARSEEMDSASSQFFIVHQDSQFLDGQYACFGYVTEGMDIVDQICENTPVTDEVMCMVAPEHQPVIESVKIID